jgi:hypothetical protein
VIDTEQMQRLAGGHAFATAAIALIAVLGAWLTIRAIRKSAGNPPPAAVLVAAIAAAACTAYSADTSWRFAADHLGMATTAERATMFSAAELALFAVALMARQNLATQQSPGTPGVLVWVITGVQVIPAFAESGAVGGFVRAFVGPVLAALLWHLAMGIELRHAKPGANSQSLLSILARELRERIMSRLGLAVRDRTAEQITRDRWTIRAVGLAARLSELADGRDSWIKQRRINRLGRRLSVAVGKAQAGGHPEQRLVLIQELAARRHSGSLATITLPTPWTAALLAAATEAPVAELPAPVLPSVSAPDTDPGHQGGQPAALPPGQPGGHDRLALSSPPDIAADARADKGADKPLTGRDMMSAPIRPVGMSARTAKPAAPRTNPKSDADKVPAVAIIRACLDNNTDDPDAVITAVLAMRPDDEEASVKRAIRREKRARTTYM